MEEKEWTLREEKGVRDLCSHELWEEKLKIFTGDGCYLLHKMDSEFVCREWGWQGWGEGSCLKFEKISVGAN